MINGRERVPFCSFLLKRRKINKREHMILEIRVSHRHKKVRE